ncbi:MAG TPA: nuclear transport factor 2 family protein [Nitriliruptorales bacterium]|nr:nuclear transport factor 2 family protein [Nitriliruptorales bacterium]
MAEQRTGADRGGGALADEVEVALDLDAIEREGLHIEDPDAGPVDDDRDSDVDHLARYGPLESVIDGFIEAYNAHDLDGVLEVLAEDCELPGLGGDPQGFSRACDDLWDRRPHALLTRGLVDDQPVAVLWDVCTGAQTNGGWERVGLFVFDRSDREDAIGLIEAIEDPATLEAAETDDPADDLLEGARWEEWYEGDGD